MGRLFLIDLKGSFYSCKYCRTPLALKEDLLSKVTAYEKSQKYKEGNFVLERCKVLDPDGHPYVPSQVVHNGQEPEIGQESEDDEEPEIGQEG
ncbi:unnamed protein product [Dovyalis caffra]|uniref:Yippee domain-containing protein n=1 Tax=Dovyalis caffra TaxID=77055 RepID=A0AAV1S1C6_9ROSI|nr:unnamed protein product [Dovyalis caffra]